jgi:hypothetical protein
VGEAVNVSVCDAVKVGVGEAVKVLVCEAVNVGLGLLVKLELGVGVGVGVGAAMYCTVPQRFTLLVAFHDTYWPNLAVPAALE